MDSEKANKALVEVSKTYDKDNNLLEEKLDIKVIYYPEIK